MYRGNLTIILAFFTIGFFGCSEPEIIEVPDTEYVDGQPVYHANDPILAHGPTFKQSELRIYTLYKPQKQRVDFNGVFHLSPNGAGIVWDYWQRKFNELTRQGFYDRFFMEFYDYMSYLATAYPVESYPKEQMLESLEKSFVFFCSSYKILDELGDFKRRQMEIYGR